MAAVAGVATWWLLQPHGDAPQEVSASNTGRILYYQDPSGAAVYSPTPKKDAQGRDYVAVRAPDETTTAAPSQNDARRILYYRNPMGLADTSPVPKKDSMGMDYIPVYADEADRARHGEDQPGQGAASGRAHRDRSRAAS